MIQASRLNIMKFRTLHILPVAAAIMLTVASCEDEGSTIGGSLTGDNVEILVDTSFTVSGSTHRIAAIKPKTNEQLIGSIEIPGYGKLSSEVVTQFLPSTILDTANFNVANIDSMSLKMTYLPTSFVGDSLAPLGITIYPLNQLLPKDIASDFNPSGYYNPTPIGTVVYNASTLDQKNTNAYRDIEVKLPTNLAKDIFQAFVDNPSDFANGQLFSKNVFPGIYIKNTFGSGRLTNIYATGLSFFFTKIEKGEDEKNDTTVAEHQYMLVTPEVISNNDIKYTMDPSLESKLNAGDNILVAPAGTESEFKFPIEDIIDVYKTKGGNKAVINGLSMQIPIDSLVSGINPPPYVLLVLKKDREEFFAQNKLPDNTTSFYAEYNANYGCYSFAALRPYLIEMLGRDEIKAEDYTFDLVPVQVTFEQLANSSYGQTQYIESEVQPYSTAPVLGQLRFDKVKIQLTFSRLQSDK